MGLLSNGSPSHEEIMEKERDGNVHASNIQAASHGAWDSEGRLKKEYLQELVEAGIDESAVRPLRFLLSKDFVLSNLKRAEVDELKWLARWMALIVKAEHPPKESGMKGEYRKFLRDDLEDGASPLSAEMQLLIEETVLDVFARATRGHEGFQQQEMSKTYAVSEVKDNKQNKGGLWGR